MGSYQPESPTGPIPRFIRINSDSSDIPYRSPLDIVYKKGDSVHYSLDTNKNRIWKIANIDEERDQYTLITEDYESLPESTLIGSNSSIASVLATKLQISHIVPKVPILENYNNEYYYGIPGSVEKTRKNNKDENNSNDDNTGKGISISIDEISDNSDDNSIDSSKKRIIINK